MYVVNEQGTSSSQSGSQKRRKNPPRKQERHDSDPDDDKWLPPPPPPPPPPSIQEPTLDEIVHKTYLTLESPNNPQVRYVKIITMVKVYDFTTCHENVLKQVSSFTLQMQRIKQLAPKF